MRNRGGNRISNASTGQQLGWKLESYLVGIRDRDGIPKWVRIQELVQHMKGCIQRGEWRTATPVSDVALRKHIQTYMGRQREINPLWKVDGSLKNRRYSYTGI